MLVSSRMFLLLWTPFTLLSLVAQLLSHSAILSSCSFDLLRLLFSLFVHLSNSYSSFLLSPFPFQLPPQERLLPRYGPHCWCYRLQLFTDWYVFLFQPLLSPSTASDSLFLHFILIKHFFYDLLSISLSSSHLHLFLFSCLLTLSLSLPIIPTSLLFFFPSSHP